MWSYVFNGLDGIVKDSYQRLALRIPSNMVSSTLGGLTGSELGHILLEFKGDEDDTIITDITNSIHSYRSKLSITIELERVADYNGLQELLQVIDPDIILVKYQFSREDTCSSIGLVSRAVEALRLTNCPLGISDVPSSEIQWIMETVNVPIKLVSFSIIDAPNLNFRTVEFIHSRECNTLMTIGTSVYDKVHYLNAYEKIYQKPPILILAKVLYQLGVIVAFSYDLGPTFLVKALALGHPFTNRGIHLAPSIVKHFVISDEHMTAIMEKSEEREAESDVDWAPFASSVAPVRVLGDEVVRH